MLHREKHFNLACERAQLRGMLSNNKEHLRSNVQSDLIANDRLKYDRYAQSVHGSKHDAFALLTLSEQSWNRKSDFVERIF